MTQLDQWSDGVYLYGVGGFATRVHSALTALDVDVIGFVCAQPSVDNFLGRPVWHAKEFCPGDLPVLVGILNHRDAYLDLETALAPKGWSLLFPTNFPDEIIDELGWAFWLSRKSFIEQNARRFEKLSGVLADTESRSILAGIRDFRSGQSNASSSYLSADPQYLNTLNEPLTRMPDVHFIDGGAYDGDTFRELSNRLKFGAAYLFEPDQANYNRLCADPACGSAIKLPLGLYSKTASISFASNASAASCIEETGGVQVTVCAIDEVIGLGRCDFIKLDIEGAEMAALKGARALLKRERPFLAISAYHKPTDLLDIPDFLSDLGLGYKISLRSHGANSFDSVIYATPN